MNTTFTSAVYVPVAISSVCIPPHTANYAVLILSRLAPHDPSLVGLHTFISYPGYPSQHQNQRNIICPDEAVCILRQHLDRVNTKIIRRRAILSYRIIVENLSPNRSVADQIWKYDDA